MGRIKTCHANSEEGTWDNAITKRVSPPTSSYTLDVPAGEFSYQASSCSPPSMLQVSSSLVVECCCYLLSEGKFTIWFTWWHNGKDFGTQPELGTNVSSAAGKHCHQGLWTCFISNHEDKSSVTVLLQRRNMKCWSKAGISVNGSPLLLSPSISLNQMLGGGRTPQ